MNWEEIRSRESLTAKESKYICNDLMSTGLEMERLIVENFGPEDYYKVAQRRIGGGRIGGKACGLLLARKLIQARMPQYMDYMEPHDSYFVGSDVFYHYLEENDCMELRRRHMKEKEKFQEADELQSRIQNGSFPKPYRKNFSKWSGIMEIRQSSSDPAVSWKMDSATLFPASMNPSSASIREAKKRGSLI